jgi:hypothetical protein
LGSTAALSLSNGSDNSAVRSTNLSDCFIFSIFVGWLVVGKDKNKWADGVSFMFQLYFKMYLRREIAVESAFEAQNEADKNSGGGIRHDAFHAY